jgi:polyisoprenoid-binding protein YceI
MTTDTETTTTTWPIDTAHSNAAFAVRHMMVATARGKIAITSGTITVVDDSAPHLASVEATLDPNTIDTGDANRDGHLRSPDFFDVATYPAITFKSTKIEATGDDTFKVTGDLTIRDVAKEVVLDATLEGRVVDAWGKDRVGFSASTTINRKDFGLAWNMAIEAGGVVVAEKVKIELDIEAVKA